MRSSSEAVLPQCRLPSLRGRDTLVMKGYGLADIENEVAATAQTVYRIGSVTKQFTSVAIMQLIEQGKLSLDDDVTKFVPNAPTHGRKVLVRHLLNHTSGIPSYTDVGNSFGLVMRLDLSQDSLLATVRNDSLQFEPGTHFYYNNTGYFLLGMIIEKVTGKPYGDYLRDALFAPNGLTSTVYCGNMPLIKRRAQGYNGATDRSGERRLSSAWTYPTRQGRSARPLAISPTWTRLLHSGKLVKAPSFATMTTPASFRAADPWQYGFGLFMDTLGTHRRIHHGGGINGFISELAYYP